MSVNSVEVPWQHEEECKEGSQVEHVESAHSYKVKHANMNWPDAYTLHIFDSL